MRVAFEGHVGGHPDAAVLGDAAHVVASEIDEHDVLGSFFLVALQLFGQPQVFFLIATAWPCAGDRVGFDATSFDAHEHLW